MSWEGWLALASNRSLPGASKYLQREAPSTSRFADRDAVQARANEVTDLRAMLLDMGCEVPDGAASWKFKCPFGAEHADGGMDKSARYYADGNVAYCFAGHGMLTPVRLRALSAGITQQKAADRLLSEAGVTTRRGWRDRYVEVSEAVERERGPKAPSLEHVVAALTMRLQEYPAYMTRQYDEDFRAVMHARIEALAEVPNDSTAYAAWVRQSLEELAPLLG